MHGLVAAATLVAAVVIGLAASILGPRGPAGEAGAGGHWTAGRRFAHLWACLTCSATLLLIIAGALVKSTGSGLAVPDWPLSYGQLMPEMKGGVFYEHGHRMVATFVGLLTVILAVTLTRVEPRPWVRRLGILAVGAVILQGMLGGLTVLYGLPPQVSIAHAGLAQVFFCVTVLLAFTTSGWWSRARATAGLGSLWKLALATAAMVYFQIILGAAVRHLGAGLSIPDFPLSYGRLIPPFESFYVTLHFSHRVGALASTLAITALALRLVTRAQCPRGLCYLSAGLGLVVCGQVMLGGWIIWSGRAVEATAAHVAGGALTLALCVAVSIIAYRLRDAVTIPEAFV